TIFSRDWSSDVCSFDLRIVGVVGLSVRRTLYARRGADGGWTLVELLVVLSIILILASLAMLQHRNSITLAKEAALRSNLFIMREAIDQYYADKGKYPESLGTLVTERYLRSRSEEHTSELQSRENLVCRLL